MNLNYLRYNLQYPFKAWKNKYLKRVTKKEAKAKDLYGQGIKEISEYTGEPLEVVKEKHHLGPEKENNYEIFKDQKELCGSEVEDFYRDCYYYIYELPLWNAETNRPKYLGLITLPYIRRNKYTKVMDFGGGAGDLSIELAQNNLDVTYCDIGEPLINLAKWRFNRRNLPVKLVKGLDNVSDKFDCIFSFDAFEHISDLPVTLKKLVSRIKTGGSLIFSGAFSGGTLHLEQNEKYHAFKDLDALMRSCGLTFQDRFAQFYFYKKLSS